eukprot:TRINITY_DN1692_c0_g1_i4.p1 TRINITY_DN1692_c0_g1~~TRINITY_DN1692_c0_g1_i4.p1  ORF type:complete len:235 (-),score=41.24 TRINITY_DN1692_c0_g1_i4:801-1505(-)
MRNSLALNTKTTILLLAFLCAISIIIGVSKISIGDSSLPLTFDGTFNHFKENELNNEMEEENLGRKRKTVDEDGDRSGYNSRVSVIKENGRWIISYLWTKRYIPKDLDKWGFCVIDGNYSFKLEYKLDPYGKYTHLLQCPLPEAVRLKRPLTFDIVHPNLSRTWNLTLYSKPPPEKPLFTLSAFIRMAPTELPYIHEWIEWQLMMGVEHIWVYDHSLELVIVVIFLMQILLKEV